MKVFERTILLNEESRKKMIHCFCKLQMLNEKEQAESQAAYDDKSVLEALRSMNKFIREVISACSTQVICENCMDRYVAGFDTDCCPHCNMIESEEIAIRKQVDHEILYAQARDRTRLVEVFHQMKNYGYEIWADEGPYITTVAQRVDSDDPTSEDDLIEYAWDKYGVNRLNDHRASSAYYQELKDAFVAGIRDCMSEMELRI